MCCKSRGIKKRCVSTELYWKSYILNIYNINIYIQYNTHYTMQYSLFIFIFVQGLVPDVGEYSLFQELSSGDPLSLVTDELASINKTIKRKYRWQSIYLKHNMQYSDANNLLVPQLPESLVCGAVANLVVHLLKTDVGLLMLDLLIQEIQQLKRLQPLLTRLTNEAAVVSYERNGLLFECRICLICPFILLSN